MEKALKAEESKGTEKLIEAIQSLTQAVVKLEVRLDKIEDKESD